MSHRDAIGEWERDIVGAVALRDEAIDRVAKRKVFDRAYNLAVNYAQHHEDFTSEDVRDWIENRDPDAGLELATEPRVLGAVMRKLGTRGIAYASDSYRIVGRKSNHCRPQRVWRGLA